MLGWFKHGLVRVVAFLVVGLTVIVSTQLLRGQQSEGIISGIRHLFYTTSVTDPAAPQTEGMRSADLPTLEIDPSVAAEVEAVVVLAPTTQTLAAVKPTIIPADCAKRGIAAGSIVLGDKIQLRFFAAVHLPSTDADFSSIAQQQSLAYERLDLSGIYDIGEDGTAALPLIGRIDLFGQSLTCAEALVSREISAQDTSVSSVSASFAARLPVTVNGAVRAPGAYTHSPGMTVNRLLNLAGASFEEGPITPQDLDNLIAQRNELRHRQLLAAVELGRLTANIAGSDILVIPSAQASYVSSTQLAALVDAETIALKQDLSVSQRSDARSAVFIAGLEQTSEDTRSQLASVTSQISILQARYDEMTSFKSRGLIQASQLDVVQSNLMELNRIALQLETDQSNLKAQVAVAKEDAQLAVQVSLQGLSQRAAALSGDISLFDVQLLAIESRLAGHGIGNDTADVALPLVVTVLRPGITGAVRSSASLDTAILPGDMVTVSISSDPVDRQLRADNTEAGDPGAAAPGDLQP